MRERKLIAGISWELNNFIIFLPQQPKQRSRYALEITKILNKEMKHYFSIVFENRTICFLMHAQVKKVY